ncbi:ABC transporter ATP-binding protein [Acrocarpospora pleiomorpha]|uniref:ABC transporter ATP-binding protein n=1 Tax=Acrocarpospora pleiomorpha TaxID=90975 RepID=UPI0014780E57|nr:ABC transporter ATP-binding protein [Acrocarpospora pleiomorpha]
MDNLTVAYRVSGELAAPALRDATFQLNPGEILGLVGESGSGKSTLGRSIIGLLPSNAEVRDGEIRLGNSVIMSPRGDRTRQFRGSHVGYVFQNALSSLNPTMRIGTQLNQVIRRHRPNLSRRERRHLAQDLLERNALRDVDRVLRVFPHQLSGGMRQRVAIALAVVARPDVLIADECTTALDVSAQAKVVDHLAGLVREEGMAMLFITHDLLLAGDLCDRICVMKDGAIMELGRAEQVIFDPVHAYTQSLLASVPRIEV